MTSRENDLLCSKSLLVKYDFILRYEASVNAIRASSFIENFPQISAKPIAFQRNLLGKLSQNRPFFVFQRNWPQNWPQNFPRNSREISRFFREFVPENPAKFDFFFRDLPEALNRVKNIADFGHKKGKHFGKHAAQPHPINFLGVHPPPPPPESPIAQSRRSID